MKTKISGKKYTLFVTLLVVLLFCIGTSMASKHCYKRFGGDNRGGGNSRKCQQKEQKSASSGKQQQQQQQQQLKEVFNNNHRKRGKHSIFDMMMMPDSMISFPFYNMLPTAPYRHYNHMNPRTMMQEYFDSRKSLPSSHQHQQLQPPTYEIVENDKEYQIMIVMPGTSLDNIHIQLSEGDEHDKHSHDHDVQKTLSIEWTRDYDHQYFKKSFSLGTDINFADLVVNNGVTSFYENNILYVNILKSTITIPTAVNIPIHSYEKSDISSSLSSDEPAVTDRTSNDFDFFDDDIDKGLDDVDVCKTAAESVTSGSSTTTTTTSTTCDNERIRKIDNRCVHEICYDTVDEPEDELILVGTISQGDDGEDVIDFDILSETQVDYNDNQQNHNGGDVLQAKSGKESEDKVIIDTKTAETEHDDEQSQKELHQEEKDQKVFLTKEELNDELLLVINGMMKKHNISRDTIIESALSANSM